MTITIQGWAGDCATKMQGRRSNEVLVHFQPKTYLPELKEHYKLDPKHNRFHRITVRNLGAVGGIGVARGSAANPLLPLSSGFVHAIREAGECTLGLSIGCYAPDASDVWKPGVHLFEVEFRLNRPDQSGLFDYPSTFATAVIGTDVLQNKDGRVQSQIDLIKSVLGQPDLGVLFA